MRTPQPQPGWRFIVGQTVQVERPNGMLELATVTAATRGNNDDPCYRCRMNGSAAQAEGVVETHYEDELVVPQPQLGCAFYVGQLVHVLPSRARARGERQAPRQQQLGRVVEFELNLKVYEILYKVALVEA